MIMSIMILIFGCAETDVNNDDAGIRFLLADMPGDYQQVNIDVVGVHLIVNDSLIEMTTNQGIYNLLELVNGKDTLLVDEASHAGKVSQVRLILGEANSVMVDSVLNDLKTPSAQQSGLKLNVHQEILPGELYTFVIDFVVEKSIVATGNGKFILKPVIRVFTEALTGSIQGVVSPADAKPYITAFNESDTAATYADSVTGFFRVRGLPEGTYSLEFLMEDYNDTILSDISVTLGEITELDSIHIEQLP